MTMNDMALWLNIFFSVRICLADTKHLRIHNSGHNCDIYIHALETFDTNPIKDTQVFDISRCNILVSFISYDRI